MYSVRNAEKKTSTIQILSALVIICITLFIIVLVTKISYNAPGCKSRFGMDEGTIRAEEGIEIAPAAHTYNYYLDLVSYTTSQFLPIYTVGKEVQTVSKVTVNGTNYLSDPQAMGIVMVACKKGAVTYSKLFNTHLAASGNDILFYSMLITALANSDNDLLILVAHNGIGDLGNITDKIRLLQNLGIAEKMPIALPSLGEYFPYILVYDLFNKQVVFEEVSYNARFLHFKSKVVSLQMGEMPKSLKI